MEQEIVQELQKRYAPNSILLHGSRASNHARPNSDWDFILLHEQKEQLPTNGRFDWKGENIEHSHHQFPPTDILREFGVKLLNARVVYEEHDIGSRVLSEAHEVYAAGLQWSAEERAAHKLWALGRINGMSDSQTQPLLFAKYAADFYQRATNYWYWAKHDRFSQPIYIALEEISSTDPEYLKLLEQFVAVSEPTEKVQVAWAMLRHCFNDT